MKKPTIEEVKEYFKDAESVADAYSGFEFNMSQYDLESVELGNGATKHDWIIYGKKDRGYDKILFDSIKGYAKILTYKNPKEETFQITKEQIKYIYDHAHYDCKHIVKEWYKKAFEEDKVELEAGRWYIDKYNRLFVPTEILNYKECLGYGFGAFGNYFELNNNPWEINGSERQATHQEVEEALKDECIRIGIKLGSAISRDFDDKLNNVIIDIKSYRYDSEWRYYSKDDYLEHHGFVVYSKGQFAKVIPTKTRQEAEKEIEKFGVNCKIID